MKHNLYLAVFALIGVGSARVAQGQLLLHNNSILDSLQSFTASTVPPSGDLNPYGVAFVPAGFPSGANIAAGDVLVANFNNSSNVQGTGTTIVSVTPTGQQAVFATSTLIGLDTALGVLSRGFVMVGNLPVPSGTPLPGSLQVFDRNGNLVTTINDANLLDSPWDLTIVDQGSTALVFVSNVLSGTVTRLNLSVGASTVTVTGKTRIGSGFGHQPNAAAVVVGPTGLAYDPAHDTLYVASTADNKIFAIGEAAERSNSAGTGPVVFADQTRLHGPLGLTLAPNGNLITANGDAVFAGGTQNALIEFTPQGIFIAQYQLDAGAPGGAFGVASTANGISFRFAAVDDDLNTLTVWTISLF
jgi:sugar lactone lactonase YvrE